MLHDDDDEDDDDDDEYRYTGISSGSFSNRDVLLSNRSLVSNIYYWFIIGTALVSYRPIQTDLVSTVRSCDQLLTYWFDYGYGGGIFVGFSVTFMRWFSDTERCLCLLFSVRFNLQK